ncbi:MAG: hypothetical protein K2Y32_20045 [Candidatus Obscuribacterales bacterium]|uniref:3'-5' exonuclease n=1 Tax=Candidatus Obscuribacter phosphatis TaxID=1906157 RepID=A0A8J7PFR7_9BACT|nr:hypothetical protein [Candidatus Obscuribacter phosphatis]MBX9941566.1 hypothetical protein [Candidatus Obscuribacterales bacterium]
MQSAKGANSKNGTNSTNNANGSSSNHPNVIDRNQAIVWARYLIDSSDFLLFGTKVTYIHPDRASDGLDQPMLVSLAVLTPDGKTLFESLVKPDEIVPNQIVAQHGLDQAIVFNAKPFSDVAHSLSRLIDGKQLLVWDMAAVQVLFDELCVKYGQPPFVFTGHSLKDQYARFVGEIDAGGANYKLQPLKSKGISAVAQCRGLIDTLYKMASSSQKTNTAETGNLGWTGQFYKPKLSTADKIKDLLGL